MKLATEKYLQLMEKQNGLNYAVLRYGNPYGIGQDPFRKFGVVAAFLGYLAKGRPLQVWGDGKVTRDFIYIDDAIEGTFQAFQYRGKERVFNPAAAGDQRQPADCPARPGDGRQSRCAAFSGAPGGRAARRARHPSGGARTGLAPPGLARGRRGPRLAMGQSFLTAYAIASPILSSCSSVCMAEIAVRTRSFPTGTPGLIDMTVKTPFSRSARQKG